MSETISGSAPPKVFISYSWDDEAHKTWVAGLARRLRNDGVDAKIDQWELVPGDRLTHFMEQAIRENDFVLLICTPNYKIKADGRKGGVGYEGDIMTADVWAQSNHRKYIPILRRGTRVTACPTWLAGKYDVDLSAEPYSEDQYHDLLTTLHNIRAKAPPLGSPPPRVLERHTTVAQTSAKSTGTTSPFEPIRIEGVLADEVGSPRNDGTSGSALYAVPFKLSRQPPPDWAVLFVRTWDHPPRFTSRHRPGIAEVRGDRIILTRTMIEEVQEVHRDTLKLVVDTVNQKFAEAIGRYQLAQQSAAAAKKSHEENVRRLAREIHFD